MKTLDKRESIGKAFIYIIIVFWFGSEILFNSTLNTILFWDRSAANRFMAVIIAVLLVIQIAFFQKYSFKELLIIAIASSAIMYSTYVSDNNIMMSAWLFVVASKYIDIDKIVAVLYVTMWIMMAVVLFMFFTGHINEIIMYRGSMVRHSWGFSHPNLLGMRFFQLIIIHFYIRRNKINLFDFFLLIFGIWLIYKVPNCQTAYYTLSVFLVLVLFNMVGTRFYNGEGFCAMMQIFFAILANVISVAFSVFDFRNVKVLKKLDALMSYRFSWCHKVYDYYGTNLFGQDVQLYKLSMNHRIHKFYLDTAYMSILVRYGIIVFMLFSVAYIFAMVYFKKVEQYMLVTVFCIYAIYGVMENSLYSLSQNVFLLALSYPLYGRLMIKDYIKANKGRMIRVLVSHPCVR